MATSSRTLHRSHSRQFQASKTERDASGLLVGLGSAVRRWRAQRKLTIRALAERAQVSERFLVQLERGEGNISVLRLADVARALGVTTSSLLQRAEGSGEDKTTRVGEESSRPTIVGLLGLRGAGKSTVGALAARELRLPFVELDRVVARQAGMDLATMFELHGEAYYRRLERRVLEQVLDEAESGRGAIIATGGSLVTEAETYALLRRRAKTVWLRAKPRDHWDRVVAQGDVRPMRGRANAMNELKTLLEARGPLYGKADLVVNTSAVPTSEAAEQIAALVRATTNGA